MTIPYTKQGAPFIDDPSNAAATFNAAKANAMDQGIYEAHLQPAVRVTHNANQSATTGVTLTLAFNTEAFDQAGGSAATMHDNVTNNSRLTCRYAGVYEIKAQIEWAASATGQRTVAIRINGATQIGLVSQDATAGGGTTSQVCPVLYALAVNDYVEVLVTQSSGGALNVLTTTNVVGPAFSMVRVG